MRHAIGLILGLVLPVTCPAGEPGPAHAQAATYVEGATFINTVGMRMISVPAGSFRMGDLTGSGRPNEKPVRTVELSAYHLGATEVTQAQWKAVMGDNPSTSGGDNYPVDKMTWVEAMEFCRRLTTMEQRAGRLPRGYRYGLPTEAQWEYACRAGTESDYNDPYGADLHELGWYKANSNRQKSFEVGLKEPNYWGFYDMHGNVLEWCLDWYQDSYRGLGTRDPAGPRTGRSKVGRGGRCGVTATYCRSANRGGATPDTTVYSGLGLRAAIVPIPPARR